MKNYLLLILLFFTSCGHITIEERVEDCVEKFITEFNLDSEEALLICTGAYELKKRRIKKLNIEYFPDSRNEEK
jgi:hypothetical protein